MIEEKSINSDQLKSIRYNIMKNDPKYMLIDRTNLEHYTVKMVCSFSRSELKVPVRNAECSSNPYCIWQLDDILDVFRQRLSKKESEPLRTYECGMCKTPNSQYPVNRRIQGLYHDRDLQLCIQIAKQKYKKVFGDNAKQMRRFKDSELIFYRTGKVQYKYKCQYKKGASQVEVIEPLIQPSLKKADENIYYNPSDFRLNKDLSKLMNRFMTQSILNVFKSQFNRLRALEAPNIEQITQNFENKLVNVYKQNMTVDKIQNEEIVVKLISHYIYNISVQALVYYPREQSWNTYILEKPKKQKFQRLPKNSQAIVHQQKIIIISFNQMLIFDLSNNFNRRFKPLNVQFDRNIYENNEIISNNTKKIELIVPIQVIPAPIIGTAAKIIPNGIQYASFCAYKNWIYAFGGRIQQNKKISNLAYKFDLSKLKDNPQWQKLKPLDIAVESAAIVRYGEYIYLIGGQTAQNVYSNKIIQFSIVSQSYRVYADAIKVKMNSIYFVTKSVREGKFVLIDIKEGDMRNNTEIKIFDAINKTVKEEGLIGELFKKQSDPKNDILNYLTYPSTATEFQSINYFISMNTATYSQHRQLQLAYGSDLTWFSSQIKQTLAGRSKN